MSKSRFVDFKAVKAAVSMEQVLQHYGLLNGLKRSGDSLTGPCPIHKGTNASQFRVSISKNCWNCFGDCKQGGNVLDFVARKDSVSIREAALRIAEWFNLSFEKPVQNRETKPSEDTKSPEPAVAKTSAEKRVVESGANKPLGFTLQNLDTSHAYLTERGLTPETVAEFGLGYCAKGSMAGRIVIPIHSAKGELLAYSGRLPGAPTDDSPKYKLPIGFRKSLELFNLHRAIREPADKPLVVVEGFFDAIKLWQHGVRKVVALMGSILSVAQEESILKHTGPDSHIILMLDEDEAGRLGREQVLQRLATKAFVKMFKFAKEGQQPDQLPAEEVQQLLGGVL